MKNKKVLIFLFIGLAIMGVMLYFIGIDFVSYCYTDFYLFFIHMEMEHHQQDCGYGFGNKKITSYGFS